MDHVKIQYNGEEILCYGDLSEDSNFDVVCEDEWEDDVWCDGHPKGGSFKDWQQVVDVLSMYFPSGIVEISAC